MTPSSQQLAARDTFNSGISFGLKARAGAGKTSTIKFMAKDRTQGLALAFNKRNAEDLAKALPGLTCSTLNSIGHRALGTTYGRLTLDVKKFYQILDNLNLKLSRDEVQSLRSDYDLARNSGYVPPGTPAKSFVSLDDLDISSDPEILHRVLRESIRMGLSRLIDFTDQIYLPAVFRVPMPKFPLIIVDEAQDLSPIQHDLVFRSLAPGAQLVVVGDPAQAIDAWRGAASDS